MGFLVYKVKKVKNVKSRKCRKGTKKFAPWQTTWHDFCNKWGCENVFL